MKDKKKIIREFFLAYATYILVCIMAVRCWAIGPRMIMGSYHENSHPICALPYVVFLYHHMKISFRFEWVSFHFIPVQEKSQGEVNYPIFFQYEACFFCIPVFKTPDPTMLISPHCEINLPVIIWGKIMNRYLLLNAYCKACIIIYFRNFVQPLPFGWKDEISAIQLYDVAFLSST